MHVNGGRNFDRQSPDTFKPPLGATNYVANCWVFNPLAPNSIVAAMPRGSSQTIIISEVYQCCNLAINAGYTGNGVYNGVAWAHRWNIFQGGGRCQANYGCPAARVWIPGNSTNGYSFRDFRRSGVSVQMAPPPDGVAPPPAGPGCDIFTTQTPHPGGMVVTLGDGSVRIVGPSIAANNNNVWVIVNSPFDDRVLPADWN